MTQLLGADAVTAAGASEELMAWATTGPPAMRPKKRAALPKAVSAPRLGARGGVVFPNRPGIIRFNTPSSSLSSCFIAPIRWSANSAIKAHDKSS